MQQLDQLACKECDLLVSIPVLSHGNKAVCPRCDYVLTRFHRHSRSKLFAFSTTAIIFMLLSLIFPFLIFNAQGREKTIYFLQSLTSMGEDTYLSVVIFMIVTTLVIPMLIMAGLNYVLVSSSLKKPLPFVRRILRTVLYLQAWNMAEIFLLGILVSMVKVASLAHVEFGWSFFAFVFYIVSMAMTRVYLDKFQLWRAVSSKPIWPAYNG